MKWDPLSLSDGPVTGVMRDVEGFLRRVCGPVEAAFRGISESRKRKPAPLKIGGTMCRESCTTSNGPGREATMAIERECPRHVIQTLETLRAERVRLDEAIEAMTRCMGFLGWKLPEFGPASAVSVSPAGSTTSRAPRRGSRSEAIRSAMSGEQWRTAAEIAEAAGCTRCAAAIAIAGMLKAGRAEKRGEGRGNVR